MEGFESRLVLIVLSRKLCSLEVNQSLLERCHYMLASHICIKFLFILLHFFLVEGLKCYDRTAHNVSLLLVIVNVVPDLIESYTCGTCSSHRRGIPKEELAIVGTSKCSFPLTVSLSCECIIHLCLKLSLQITTNNEASQWIFRINYLEFVVCRGIKPVYLATIVIPTVNRKEFVIILDCLLLRGHNSLVEYILPIVLHLQVISLLELLLNS